MPTALIKEEQAQSRAQSKNASTFPSRSGSQKRSLPSHRQVSSEVWAQHFCNSKVLPLCTNLMLLSLVHSLVDALENKTRQTEKKHLVFHGPSKHFPKTQINSLVRCSY